jgi:hypothetical protein
MWPHQREPPVLPHRRVSVGTCWRSAAAGFNNPTSESLATLWAVGAVNVVATLVAVLCVVTFVYVRWFLPETKGQDLGRGLEHVGRSC